MISERILNYALTHFTFITGKLGYTNQVCVEA